MQGSSASAESQLPAAYQHPQMGASGSAAGAPAAPRRTARLMLAGDTMLGRCVAETILRARAPDTVDPERMSSLPIPMHIRPPKPGESAVFSSEVVALAKSSNAIFLNLECCISENHQRWNNPHKPFFFRAPPVAIEDLKALKVDGVTLANNHALDYDVRGLLDTLESLDEAGIKYTGAGRNVEEARKPVILQLQDMKIGIIGVTDHPQEFEATSYRPGVAYIDLQRRNERDSSMGPLIPQWCKDTIRALKEQENCDCVIVTPHW